MGHLLNGSVVRLMVTSSKRTYITHHVFQVCWSQSPCPCGRPLLTCASTGDTLTLKGSVLVRSLGPTMHKGLFEPSEHLCGVWLYTWFYPPSYRLVGLLLCHWMWSIFFCWDSTFSCQWLFSCELEFWSSHRRRWVYVLLLRHLVCSPCCPLYFSNKSSAWIQTPTLI